jgi:hypothetical protein
MAKVKKHVKVTIEVMGKEMSMAEAESLYQELKVALKKTDTIVLPTTAPLIPYQPYRQPYYDSTRLIGDNITGTSWPDGDALYQTTKDTARGY